MELTLYQYTGSPVLVDKSAALSESVGKMTINGEMRDTLNVEDPLILLEVEYPYNFMNYNYAHITNLGYYYFMEKPMCIRTGLWQIQLHMDYLMSFKSEIKKMSGIIARNEHVYNTKLIDDRLHFLGYKEVNTISFPKSVKNGECFILAVNGR